jgi:hypothetical protein
MLAIIQSSSFCLKNIKIKLHNTIILSVFLCGCEVWSLTLRDKHRLSVFENIWAEEI